MKPYALGVFAALALAGPAAGQTPDPFLSVPQRPSATPAPAPAVQRPAPAPRAAPPPATVPPLPVGASFGDKGYHCPANGTIVIRQAGGRDSALPYGGPDPKNPLACLMTINGNVGSYLFGMVETGSSQASDFSDAYKKVLSGPPGTVAEFLQKEGPLGIRNSWNWHLQNEALEALQIGGQTRPTIRIAVVVKGASGNRFEGTWHRWFDVQTGAMIQQSFQSIHGDAPKDQDWTATRIVVPKP
jgi:hypothetical protein